MSFSFVTYFSHDWFNTVVNIDDTYNLNTVTNLGLLIMTLMTSDVQNLKSPSYPERVPYLGKVARK
jgi:hypothetical protein